MRVMKLCVPRLMSACNQRGGSASIIINLKNFVTIMRTAVASCVTCNLLVWADGKTDCRLLCNMAGTSRT